MKKVLKKVYMFQIPLPLFKRIAAGGWKKSLLAERAIAELDPKAPIEASGGPKVAFPVSLTEKDSAFVSEVAARHSCSRLDVMTAALASFLLKAKTGGMADTLKRQIEERDREAQKLAEDGLTIGEIAHKLGLSHSTAGRAAKGGNEKRRQMIEGFANKLFALGAKVPFVIQKLPLGKDRARRLYDCFLMDLSKKELQEVEQLSIALRKSEKGAAKDVAAKAAKLPPAKVTKLLNDHKAVLKEIEKWTTSAKKN